MQEETSNITRNFYDPMTGHTIQRDCPLYEWTPGTLSTSPSVFYEPEYIDEDSEVFGSIDGFSVPESSLVVTPYVSVIWYKDGSYPRVYGKCCVLPQRLVAKNTKVNFWDLFGEFEIDFPLEDGTMVRKPAKTMLGYSKVYMKTLGRDYQHINEGNAVLHSEDVQVLFDVISNRFYENVLNF